MKNLITTLFGVLQIIGSAAFAWFKLSHGLPFSEVEQLALFATVTSGFKSFYTADAKS